MKIFTLANGKVETGCKTGTHEIKSANITIPVVTVGEEGRGREIGMLPCPEVKTPCPNRKSAGGSEFAVYSRIEQKCEKCGEIYLPHEHGPLQVVDNRMVAGTQDWQNFAHPEAGEVVGRLMTADVGQTKAGKPRLFPESKPDNSRCIVVLKTMMGYRGGANHTGDREYAYYQAYNPQKLFNSELVGDKYDPSRQFSEEEAQNLADEYEMTTGEKLVGGNGDIEGFDIFIKFLPFPGEILVSGRIAQGTAGAMGSSAQHIAIVPANVWFRTSYSGRLYSAPSAHYYRFNGQKVIVVTWEERQMLEEFE